MSSNKPKKAPKGDYAVGYARPPKDTQFQPGQSGNPEGRPHGRPSLDELLLEEAARVVKLQVGDKVMHIDKDRALMRKLFDMALHGKVPAIQLVLARLAQAQAALSAKAEPQAEMTEAEIALLAMMSKMQGCPMYGSVEEFRYRSRERLRAFARERFFAFYRLLFPTLAPEATFSGALHFQALARALERVANGEIRRLLIAIPPRHGKSLFASVAFPAWILGRDPTRKIICASYGDQLSKDFSNRFRDLMWSPDYQALFPGAVIAPNGSSLSEVRLTSKGYRLATTVQGPATGKGAHIIIVDDPFKAVEAASESARNAVYDWFKGSLMTRFDNPAEGAVIVVMQRLHQDDLIGRLRDEGGWEYLAMPGECFERTVYDLGDGQSWTLNPGDLLYPERFDRTALDQLAFDLGEAQYNAQILQRPSPPGGALIKLKYFQRYETAPSRFEAIVQSWDPAVVDTETAAFSVCTTWGILGRKLYLIDVLRKRLEFHKIEPAILHMKEKHNAGCVVLETAGVGLAIGNALVKREGARRWLCDYDPTIGKVERAIAQTPKIERKRVYLPVSAPWLETFEAEVASFPMSKYFDQVDSMVQFLYLLDHRNRWTIDLSAVVEYPEQPF